jgi:hypothetical protein
MDLCYAWMTIEFLDAKQMTLEETHEGVSKSFQTESITK